MFYNIYTYIDQAVMFLLVEVKLEVEFINCSHSVLSYSITRCFFNLLFALFILSFFLSIVLLLEREATVNEFLNCQLLASVWTECLSDTQYLFPTGVLVNC